MINRLTTLVIAGMLTSIFGLLDAQEKYTLPGGRQTDFGLDVSRGLITGHTEIASFFADPVRNAHQTYLRLSIAGAFPASETGMPGLPVFSKLVEADTANNYRIAITTLDSTLIDLEEAFGADWILPVQPSARKNRAVSRDTLFEISPAYMASGRMRPPKVRISYQGRMRGVPIARIEVAPFWYDPLKKQLTVYHNLTFMLIPEHSPEKTSELRSPVFRRSMSGVVMDNAPRELKRIVQDEPVTMVILSDTLFRQALQPLVAWKRLKGFRVIEAYTSDASVGYTAASIREYMSELYHDPPAGMAPPTYLLIAGDVEHVPVSQSTSHVTDLYYTTFDGPEDYLPEMFHGRISVKNDTQLTHVVDKILMYEKYEFPDPAFLDRTILIAGYDASYAPVHGNGQINYASGYYFNESKGVDAKVYLHPQAASLDMEIRQEISLGAALVNYTGHGEYDGWLDPSLRMTHLAEMENLFQFGLMIGNGCSTNQFSRSFGDCFAEAILKLKDRGAIGYIGCTNDSYWDEDYYWSVGVGPISAEPDYALTTSGYYDKLFHPGEEPVEDWSPSLGEMIFAGNMTVQQSTTSRKKYYWEIYQLMGDPSLVPWFKVPGNEKVTHPSLLPDGAGHISVKASAYDYVAISSGGQLIQAAHTDMFGQVYLQLPDTILPDTLVLVVTGDLRQPYVDTILRGSLKEGYLELADYQLAEESQVEDALISPGEIFSLDLRILNSSENIAPAGSLTLFCSEDFVELVDPDTEIGAIQPGETIALEAAFRIAMKGAPPDRTSFSLGLSRTGTDEGNTLYLKEMVHAPEFHSLGVIWDDRPYGNGNGVPEPAEQLLISWDIRNSGSYQSDSLIMQSSDAYNAMFDTFRQVTFGTIPSGSSKTFAALVLLSEESSSSAGMQLPFASTDLRYAVNDSVTFVVGNHFEDFSSGNLSRFHWINGPAEWIADQVIFSEGPYSMRSAPISHSESSSLKIELNLSQSDTLSFRYKVSSESGYDFLEFLIDDVMMDRWSGTIDWKLAVFPVDSGQHVLEWRYDKDSNTDRGEDAAWIDDVVFPAGAFIGKDMGVLKPLHPLNSRALGQEESLEVLLINSGKDTINGFTVGYRLGDGNWSDTTVSEVMLPSQQLELILPAVLDLSGFATYNFSVAVQVDGDVYPGNDTLNWNASHYMYPDVAVSLLDIDSAAYQYIRLRLGMENLGNMPVETLYYSLYLDEKVTRDSAELLLTPGSTTEISVTLIDADMDVEQGWHEYLFVADADSVPGNNLVEGSVFWNVLALGEDFPEQLRIYPNPVLNEFRVQVPGALSHTWQISFYDLGGRMVFRDVFSGAQKLFRAGEVFSEEGIYVIQLADPGGKKHFSGKVRVESIRRP